MGNAFLCRPMAITSLAVSGQTAAGPGSNMLNDRLGRAWQVVPTGGAVSWVADLGSLQYIDTIAMLATNANGGDQVAWTASKVADFSTVEYASSALPLVASAESAGRPHRQAMHHFPLTQARYVQAQIATTANPFSVGRLLIGQSWQPADTIDYGWELGMTDRGKTDLTDAGPRNSMPGTRHLQYRWAWGWLTQDEARGKGLEVLGYAGSTRPVLFCVDPEASDVHNLIGYGNLSETPKFQQIAVDGYSTGYQLDSELIFSL